MNSTLNVWKNIIWIVAMVIALLALIVGFVFAAFGSAGFYTEENLEAGLTPPVEESSQSSVLLQLPETADGGQAYVDSLHFLVDSSLIGLRDYSLVGAYQVWGSNAGNIPADSIADPTIRYPVDGKEVQVSAAVAAVKPSVLVISLGMDALHETNESDFIANYTALINNIRAYSPDTKIVLCSPCSVTGGYAGTDGMNNTISQSLEGWIQTVCRNTGVYYADVADVVTDSSGSLFTDYAGSNGKMLNTAGVTKVIEYLRCHVVS